MIRNRMRNHVIAWLLVLAGLPACSSTGTNPSGAGADASTDSHTQSCPSLSWSRIAGSPAGTAISGSAPNDVWVLAPHAVTRGDGTTWTVVPTDCSDPTQILDALWVSGTNDVWIAGTACGSGDGGLNLRHWDGAKWTPLATHDNRVVQAFWGFSPNDVWGATTLDDQYLGHWDGRTWDHVDSSHYGPLAGGAPGDVWIAGSHLVDYTPSGNVSSLDLTTLGIDETACTSGGRACVNAGWAAGKSNVWFVADGGKALHFDGTSWTSVPTGTTSNLKSIWGSSVTDVWAVGDRGALLHFDGTGWSSISSPTASDLSGVWSSGPCDVWAVGDAVYHGSP